MPVSRTRFWRRPVTLTPLIDIIFLLLLFFMLGSSFTRFAELPLMTAGSGATDSGQRPLFLQLTPEGPRLNGVALSFDALPSALDARAPGAEAATVTLLVTLDAAVTSQDLVDLLVPLRARTWLAVSVLG